MSELTHLALQPDLGFISFWIDFSLGLGSHFSQERLSIPPRGDSLINVQTSTELCLTFRLLVWSSRLAGKHVKEKFVARVDRFLGHAGSSCSVECG